MGGAGARGAGILDGLQQGNAAGQNGSGGQEITVESGVRPPLTRRVAARALWVACRTRRVMKRNDVLRRKASRLSPDSPVKKIMLIETNR